MSSEVMHQIVEMIESEAHSRPSPSEFEMAYQARVAADRIRSAIKHASQFSTPTDQMREASLQLLEALERLDSVDRHFQGRTRTRKRSVAGDQTESRAGAFKGRPLGSTASSVADGIGTTRRT
jgi:hypothetical protein